MERIALLNSSNPKRHRACVIMNVKTTWPVHMKCYRKAKNDVKQDNGDRSLASPFY